MEKMILIFFHGESTIWGGNQSSRPWMLEIGHYALALVCCKDKNRAGNVGTHNNDKGKRITG
jgi:hypothetical protein